MDPKLEILEKRLLRLERSNQKLKLGFILAFVLSTAIVSIGAQQSSKRTFEANEFLVRDANGNLRARLSADSLGDASLVFYNASTKTKGIFGADRLVFSDLADTLIFAGFRSR